MYSRRKIKIKVKAEEYAKIMNLLKIKEIDDNGYIEEVIDVEDSKWVYKCLVENNIDWETVTENIPTYKGVNFQKHIDQAPAPKVIKESVTPISTFIHSSENPWERNDDADEIKNFLIEQLGDKLLDKDSLLSLYGRILEVKSKSPALRFTKSILNKEIIPYVSPKIYKTNIEIAMSALIEEFIKGETKTTVADNLVENLKRCWSKIIPGTNLTQLMEMIYDVKLGNIIV